VVYAQALDCNARYAQDTQGTTEILQRAYVSVQPGGLGTTTKSHLLAHVNFKNVVHLPASDFKWIIQELIPSDQDDWKPPPISDSDLQPAGVLPIDTTFKRGSKGLEYVPSNEFIYVWGRVTYLDGFGKRRFTNFCHRYNTAVRKIADGGAYIIREEDARITSTAMRQTRSLNPNPPPPPASPLALAGS